MDIRYLTRRNHDYTAHRGNAGQTSATAAQAEAASTDVAGSQSSALQAATTPNVSRAGRLLNVLQNVEQRHPQETKKVLSNIADALRADARRAGPWGGRLEKWADRFQDAADTGDMSKLMPRRQPQGHFSMRAYQQAQHIAEPEADAEAMVARAADAALARTSAVAAAAASGTAQPADDMQNTAVVDTAEWFSGVANSNDSPSS